MSSPRMSEDKAVDQLKDYKKTQPYKPGDVLTRFTGAPIGDKISVVTIGPRGPVLLQDQQFVEEIAHFARERIPERVVHAKGAGAFGYFEVTRPEIVKYSKASLFSRVGKRTPIAVRFSQVAGESGSPDTVRDPRGFAVKFYTDEGNYDLVGNNTPIFFNRDPMFFPSFIHTQKRNPQTHLKDVDMVWDFFGLRPETTHQVCFLFSDRGIPDGHRHQNGYGSHTYKFINAKDEAVYCKYHYKTNQGIKNLSVDRAAYLAGAEPDYALKDLYNAIANRNYPFWTLYVQIMTYDEAECFEYNPFDLTKVWPQKQFPLIEVGKLVLNRNPVNYFAEVEQIAFSPANFVPGIASSPDKMLQGRLFSYDDTHRHRLGANFNNIPVNRPRCPFICPTERDGPYVFNDNQAGMPNYYPNSFLNAKDNPKYNEPREHVTGDIDRHDSSNEDNFTQVGDFWTKVLKEDEKERLVENLAEQIKDAQPFIRDRAVGNFAAANEDFGARLRLALFAHVKRGNSRL